MQSNSAEANQKLAWVKLLQHACERVHAQLGQQSEATLRNALEAELQCRGFHVTRENMYVVQYETSRGFRIPVGVVRADIVATTKQGNVFVLELKSTPSTSPSTTKAINAQLRRYDVALPMDADLFLVVFAASTPPVVAQYERTIV